MMHEQVNPVSSTKAVTRGVSLPTTYWEVAQKIAAGNVSKGIRVALAYYAKHNELREVPHE